MTSPPTIMIIDDSDVVRDVLSAYLEASGFAVASFESAVAAWSALANKRIVPAVIVLDHSMPVMDGAAFRRLQLADPGVAHIPVIVYSGTHRVEMPGAFIVLKSVAPETLVSVVRKLCSLKKRRPTEPRVTAVTG